MRFNAFDDACNENSSLSDGFSPRSDFAPLEALLAAVTPEFNFIVLGKRHQALKLETPL
jgi:hypothetical protein